MAPSAAAPPHWESLGQQALGEEQEGDETKARVFLPKTSLSHLPVYFLISSTFHPPLRLPHTSTATGTAQHGHGHVFHPV